MVKIISVFIFCLGFTLFGILLIGALTGKLDNTTCVGGYVFAGDMNGSLRQVLNEQGGGVPCKK